MKAHSLVIAVCCCISSTVYAQNLILDAQAGKFAESNVTSQSFARDLDEVRKHTDQKSPFSFVRQEEGKSQLFLDFKTDIVQQIVDEPSEYLELSIPVDKLHTVDLELIRKDILAPGFVVTTASGQVDQNTDPYLFYHGSVKGHNDNWAAVSIIDGEMTVFINDRQGSYTINKLQDSDEYVFFSETELKIPFDFTCEGEDRISAHTHDKQQHHDKSRSAAASCPIPIYLEVDHLGYMAMGSSVEQTRNFALSLFSQVIALYDADPVNIPLKISAIKIWDSADPYLAVEDAEPLSKRIESFADMIQNDYPGRIAHLMTIGNRSVSGSAVNNGGVLCNKWTPAGADPDGPTGAWAAAGWTSVLPEFENYTVYSPSVLVVTHELAHNLSSTHTFSCAWGPNGDQAIDNCRLGDPNCPVMNRKENGYLGTIMGYCTEDNSSSNPRMEFHPEVLARIKNHYNLSMETCSDLICEKECAVASAVEIQVGKEYIGRTSDGSSAIASYSCDEEPNATGPEVFHRIVIPESKRYVFIFQGLADQEADLTAYLLENDCLASRCFGKISVNRLTGINYIAGTYYIAVDGNNGDDGIYRLRMLEVCSEQPPMSGTIQTGDYYQNSEIISGGQVASEANVRFLSNEGVALQSEFEVPGLSEFQANIGECYEDNQSESGSSADLEWNTVNYELPSVSLQIDDPREAQVQYSLPSAGKLDIELLDGLGQTVAQPINQVFTAAGSYTLQIPDDVGEHSFLVVLIKLDGKIIAETRIRP